MRMTRWAAFGLILLQAPLAAAAEWAQATGEQERAVQAIKKLGGTVTQDEKAPGRPVIGVRLDGSTLTDAGLKELAGFKQLQSLSLSGTKVTDAGLKQLAGLTQLQTLMLECTNVTDAGLKELATLTQLHWLYLEGTTVTDTGLNELAVLKQLQVLSLEGTKVTDAGLKKSKVALPECCIWK